MINVEYITHSGDDLLVCNAARISFDKMTQWEEVEETYWEDNALFGGRSYTETVKKVSERDQKLIKYLATHGHWSPFAHPQVTLRINAPVFVTRQLQKHVVGLVWSEVSRRYVDDEPELYVPNEWRGRPTNGMKQGSSDETIPHQEGYTRYLQHAYYEARSCYEYMIEEGVAPEMARMVLPQAMMTQWFWTGSLSAFARVCKLRLDSHAQKETRDVAEMIASIIEPLFPVSFKALMDT